MTRPEIDARIDLIIGKQRTGTRFVSKRQRVALPKSGRAQQ